MIIDGVQIAEAIQKEIKEEIDKLPGRKPCLAVILIGDNPASKIYVSRKTKACEATGILSIQITLPVSTSEIELVQEIEKLNQNAIVDGILVQLPLPPHITASKIIQAICPSKDVDGFHPINLGKLLIGESDGFISCTPLGIQTLLQRSNINISGLNALIIGRSNIVGKPLAALLMQNKEGGNATVTVAHSLTKNIKKLTLEADLIVAAMGHAHYLTQEMVKKGTIVIDVGVNKINDASSPKGYRIVGDVDYENLKNHCSFITPVPGGVGPMTIAMLLSNTLKSYKQKLQTDRT